MPTPATIAHRNPYELRLLGFLEEAGLPDAERHLFVALLDAMAARSIGGGDPLPQLRVVAKAAGMPRPMAQRVATHLRLHHWVGTRTLIPSAGLDCDCPNDPAILGGYGHTALYRLFNQIGMLLYVGITNDLTSRMSQHAADKPWWPKVARKTVAWYDTRDDADLAETLAIAAERPRYNKAKLYAPTAGVEFWLPGDLRPERRVPATAPGPKGAGWGPGTIGYEVNDGTRAKLAA